MKYLYEHKAIARKLEVKGSIPVVDVSKGAGLLNEVKPANKVMNLHIMRISTTLRGSITSRVI
ncbi:hypothetical protein Sjap_011431 [Stephania japonica]|uniref:Uncharacterized protein n=1 Tax=Stephania japonica TaxID=461633 RepID=A0AAP0P5J3_9MAGN